ncbi:glycosyltransferase family A protein [Solwaraspora sp. WMMD406]|uniref:glycosyltransferase family A protein n=1 Tax=Solwaraspora sp. WMMD406 TaxID=3016095 RepID=UPI002417A75B|nr:glycosyltransferase family A protein [Solwaraspora sp. WMMD406]MDG4765739.1 glycosyltransferase family A protein [Solwaraspora sp. WMMD406]
MDPTYFQLMCRPGPAAAVAGDAGPAAAVAGGGGAASHRDGAADGVTVLVPTYSPVVGDRVARLRRCLDSVARSATGPVSFVVVDNGLTAAAAGQIGSYLAGTGRPYLIVDATAAGTARSIGGRSRYTAAAARDAGLDALAALPDSSPVRRRHLLFLDDDTALAPDALPALTGVLDRTARAVAACPRVVPVADPGQWLASGATAGHGRPRRLAGAVHDGRYDLLSVTAFGSLVTGRTVGLLTRQAPVLDHVRRRGPLFYPDTPYGSSEDMLAMAMLSRLGELWSVPAALVADEARDTPGATRSQQYAWGYDHAWLAGALSRAGVLAPGLHVLHWSDGAWCQTRLSWAGGGTGVLINPDEVAFGYQMLRAAADAGTLPQLFDGHAGQLRVGLDLLGRVLRRWRGDRPAARPHRRDDLPALADRRWDSLRDGLDALLGHLAGNIAGSAGNLAASASDTAGNAGTHVLYGARQPAADAAVAVPATTHRSPSSSISAASIGRSMQWSTRSAS